MPHPRYDGPVIDAHCHYDESTRGRVHAVNTQGGLVAAIHLWDVVWPPADPVVEAASWGALEPALLRCHVPDFSRIGEPSTEVRLESALRAAHAAGVVGIKVWKNLGLWLRDTEGERLAIDDPRLEVLWATAAELGLPVAVHQGDPPAFFAPLNDDNPRIEELRAHPEWWYGGEGFPSLAQIHEELESVISANPATTFVVVHFGCFMSWPDIRRMLAKYSNYYLDTAAAIADMGVDGAAESARRIIVDNPDRVIFGTDLIRTRPFDMPVAESGGRWDVASFFDRHWAFFETAEPDLEHPLPAQGNWTVTGLDLPSALLPRLYWQNALAVFRLPDEVMSAAKGW